MSRNGLRLAAVFISLAWAAMWTLFILAATLGEPGTVVQKVLVITIGIGFVLGCTLAPMINARRGGAIQMVAGLALIVANYTFFGGNPPSTQMFLLFTMALPPVVAGALFLLSERRPHSQPG